MCPKSAGESVGVLLGIAAALIATALLLFRIRHLLPVGVIKLGVSMLQVRWWWCWVWAAPLPPPFLPRAACDA